MWLLSMRVYSQEISDAFFNRVRYSQPDWGILSPVSGSEKINYSR
jgi:hypothetical protein